MWLIQLRAGQGAEMCEEKQCTPYVLRRGQQSDNCTDSLGGVSGTLRMRPFTMSVCSLRCLPGYVETGGSRVVVCRPCTDTQCNFAPDRPCTTTCDVGYESSPSPPEVKCQSTGLWAITPCTLIQCPAFDHTAFGVNPVDESQCQRVVDPPCAVTCREGWSGNATFPEQLLCRQVGAVGVWAIAPPCAENRCSSFNHLDLVPGSRPSRAAAV
eukprot:gene9106-55471_t